MQVPVTKEGIAEFSKAIFSGSKKLDPRLIPHQEDVAEFVGKSKDDIAEAWRRLAKKEGKTITKMQEKFKDYTWHHEAAQGKLSLIDSDVHDAIQHTGGHAMGKAGFFTSVLATVFPLASSIAEADVVEEAGSGSAAVALTYGTIIDLTMLAVPVDEAKLGVEGLGWVHDKVEEGIRGVLEFEDDSGISVFEGLSQLPWRMTGGSR